MFKYLEDKALERALKVLAKQLTQVDYGVARHELMKMKWQALRENDNATYNELEKYEKLIDDLEDIFGVSKEGKLCQ